MAFLKKYHRECSKCGENLDKHLVICGVCPRCPKCGERLVKVNFFEIGDIL